MRQPDLRAAHRLALNMGCTVAELGDRMTAEEFGRWCAFWRREPPAAQLLPWVLAQLLSALANGPLKPPAGVDVWRAQHFAPLDPWALSDDNQADEAPAIGDADSFAAHANARLH